LRKRRGNRFFWGLSNGTLKFVDQVKLRKGKNEERNTKTEVPRRRKKALSIRKKKKLTMGRRVITLFETNAVNLGGRS